MEEKFYRQLVRRYIDKKLTDEELEVFVNLMSENKLDKYILETMDEHPGFESTQPDEPQETVVRTIRPKTRFVAAAAAVLVLVSIALYFFKSSLVEADSKKTARADARRILPGGNKAILTLADGKQVILDHQKAGELLTESVIPIKKAKDGVLVYDLSDIPSDNLQGSGYHKIETPKGGQYQVILPDGSEVWLNSYSSIRFPVVFGAEERRVEITGEVYFEVAPNKKLPFRVVSAGQMIEVLGTHFNVNAYEDEELIKTTLLEGRVKVQTSNSESSRILQPGQQAMVSRNQEMIRVQTADLEEATAWKNGYFKFSRIDIKGLMRQISRWYDIEVEYRGEVPKDELVGKIKRSEDVAQVLRILELGKIDFQVEGRKIIVGKF